MKHSATIDSEGLHLISDPGPNSQADIVFVHGLGGSSHNTWRYGKEGRPDHFFWPAELGADLPSYALWTVGYPAGFTELGKPGMIIEKRAGNLSQKLANAGLGNRPLLFITHSMGGLVVKSLIVTSQTQADSDRKRLVSMIRGIVFCATPHRGSAFADAAGVLGKFLGGSQPHVDEMKANADQLDLLHEKFIDWQHRHPIPVLSFSETVQLFHKRWFFRTVPLGLVVPRASANTGIAGYSLNDVGDDHITLVKPRDRRHDVYKGVLRWIQEQALPPAENAINQYGTIFQNFIEERTCDFVGRDYVFTDIHDFIKAHRNGYFIIVGDPGQGKSAIVAEYVRRSGCVAHFNIRAEGISSATQFLENICTQIIDRYGLDYSGLPDGATNDGLFLSNLLSEASQKLPDESQLVVAVDALDESTEELDAPIGSNVLHLPSTLPSGVYFLLSRRPGKINLLADTALMEYDLREHSDESDRDIRTAILRAANRQPLKARIDSDAKISLDEFVDVLAKKSETNFMYLRHVLFDINKRELPLDLEALPTGLTQYYENHWIRMGMTRSPLPKKKIKIVYVLTASRLPVTSNLVSEFCGYDELSTQEVIDEWKQFLHRLSIDGKTHYRIYHESFKDFLYRKDIVQAAGVEIEDVKKSIAQNLRAGLLGEQ